MKTLQDIVAPQDNANDQLITIVSLPFPNGANVTTGSVVLEYENSKTTVEVRAEADGFINYLCAVDQEVPIGTKLARILDEPVTSGSEAQDLEGSVAGKDQRPLQPRFSRAAAALVESEKLDKDAFAGLAFVTSADVKRLCDLSGRSLPGEATGAGMKQECEMEGPEVLMEALSPEKRTEIRYLSDVQPGNLNSTVFVSLSVRLLLEYVGQNSAFFKKSILPLVIKETQPLLQKYKQFNAFYSHHKICRYKAATIGLALDLGNGLKVVKLPDVSVLSLAEIEVAVVKQVQKYFKGRLEPADVGGSTFTITDLSQEGVLFFTPLINRKQSAVLSLCAYDKDKESQIVGLTFDHRVATGREATMFLRELKRELESYPGKMPAWKSPAP